MELVICDLVQLVYVFIPQVPNLEKNDENEMFFLTLFGKKSEKIEVIIEKEK